MHARPPRQSQSTSQLSPAGPGLVHVIGGGPGSTTSFIVPPPVVSSTSHVPKERPLIGTSRVSYASTPSQPTPCSIQTQPLTASFLSPLGVTSTGPAFSQLELFMRIACTNAVCPSETEHA